MAALDVPPEEDTPPAEKEVATAEVELVVIYPHPTDVEQFEKLYTEEHIPMAIEKLAGKTKIVATKVTASPGGTPRFYRIAEIPYPSCTASQAAQEAIAHAESISTGGEPIFLVAEEILSFPGENTNEVAA